MAQTISGTVTQTVTITSNPVTITSAGSVVTSAGAAITGPAGLGRPTAGWTVSNAGIVTASAAKADAIDLIGGGSISNTGTISGYQNGVDITSGLGVVTNSGTLESSPTVIVSGSPGNVYEGVYLAGGGSVTNTDTGVIFGGIGGVYIIGGSGTVTNAGDIHTTTLQGNGIDLEDGGTITNTGTGSIYGDFSGISVYTAAATITNAGSIGAIGLNGYGIYLGAGGTITNTGSIVGSNVGVYGGAGTFAAPISITNSGYVYGSDTGIDLTDGGRVTNLAGGTILGTVGITITTGTVTNAGTIGSNATNGKAITFSTTGATDRLIVDPGAVFDGTVTGGGVASTLDLAVGSTTGTLAGVGTTVTNFDTIAFDASAGWVVDDTFAALGGVTVTGFASTDSFLLTGVTGVTSSFNASTETLTLTSGSATSVVQFGSVALGGTIQVLATGGNTTISLVPCFAAGTRIATPRGSIVVDSLCKGDDVLTAQGDTLPIIWAGHRWVDCETHPEPDSVRPILIEAHAFAEGMPCRTLFLSPDHAVFAHGVLIPIKHLVNGTSIRISQIRQVIYHHIELARHAVILAEGLPAESYLDTGDRLSFAVPGGAQQLHPTFGVHRLESQLIWDALGCAPLQITGPEVDQVRMDLASRATHARRAA
jgi:collagen type I/II/III/V/XI/XXIV/XXVII alpha